MISSCTSPPVWLNGWKHHLGFVCRQLNDININNEAEFIDFCRVPKDMGSSLSDLYTGELSINNIREQILDHCIINGFGTRQEFFVWINKQESGFRELHLSDKSRWTLLKGNDPEYFIHIHPSRYSPSSIRIKTNLLRTALALHVWQVFTKEKKSELTTINLIRSKYLNLSLVDHRHIGGIMKTMELLGRSCLPG